MLCETRQIYVTLCASDSSAWEIWSCFICCSGDERLPSLIISTGITSLALEVNLLNCRLQFQANNAQLITANASSGPILETPQRVDLLICLCKRSFFSVPQPGGMSERHPLWMCLRRHSSWWKVSLGKQSFQENNNRYWFASISSELGLLVVLSVPRSPFRRKMRDNSEENCLAQLPFLELVWSIL